MKKKIRLPQFPADTFDGIHFFRIHVSGYEPDFELLRPIDGRQRLSGLVMMRRDGQRQLRRRRVIHHYFECRLGLSRPWGFNVLVIGSSKHSNIADNASSS